MAALSKLCIQGYKSISGAAEIDFAPLNILIGANGAGKSNLISFFTLLNQIVAGNLQYFIQKQGGPDVFLSYGRKVTPNFPLACTLTRVDTFSIKRQPISRLILIRKPVGWTYDSTGSAIPGPGHEEIKAPDQLNNLYNQTSRGT